MHSSDKGKALYTRYKKFQKIDVLMLAVAAMAFVFLKNFYFTAGLVILTLVLETKVYRCPHCNGTLDPRKKIQEESSCPRCDKYIFKI